MRSRRISKSTGKTTKIADVTTSKSRATRSKRRQLKNDQLEKELNVVSDRIATSTNSKKQHCKKRKPAPSPSKGKKKPPPSSLQKIKKKQKHVESDNKSDNDDDKKLQVVVADDDDDDETKTKSTAISSTPTTVAVEATAEDAGDKAGYAAVCCAAHVEAPTTTTTTTTKNKKTKGYFDPTTFPQLQHGSFAVAFCPDGSNKLIVDPSFIPGVGCLNCGKQFDSFGNIAHHVTNSYPREMDKADGSKGDLKKKGNLYIGTCADAGDTARVNQTKKRAEWESKNTPNTPLCTVTMEEARVIILNHLNIADDSKPPAISQEGKTELM